MMFAEGTKPNLAVHLQNGKCCFSPGMFGGYFWSLALHQLNLKMQGKGKDVIQFEDFGYAFVEKLWKSKR